MEEQKKDQKKQVKKGSKKKLLGILLAIPVLGLVLVVGLFLYITSEGFFQNQILPQLNQQLGGNVKVDNSKVNPLSQLKLSNVSIQSTKDSEKQPVLKVKELDVRYDALKFLFGGELLVKKVLVESPEVHLKMYKDNTSNADFKSSPAGSETAPAPAPSKKSKAPKVLVQAVNINNANITIESEQEDNSWAVQKIEGFNFSIDQLGNGKKGVIKLSSNLSNTNGEDKVLAALAGQFNIELSEELAPVNASGDLSVNVKEAQGAFSDLSDVSSSIQVALNPDSLEKFSFVVSRSGEILGQLSGQGPISAEDGSAALSLSADNINKSVLNLFAAGSGGDFGSTNFSLDISYKGQNNFNQHELVGSLTGQSIQWISNGNSTPTTDLSIGLKASFDVEKNLASVPELKMTMTEAGKNIIDASLSQPLTVDVSGEKPNLSDGQLSVNLNGFDLAKWTRGLDPESKLAGLVQSSLHITSKSNGEDLKMDLATTLTGLSTGDTESPLHNASVFLNTNASLAEFANFKADKIGLRVDGKDGALVSMDANASYAEQGDLSLVTSIDLFNSKNPDQSEKLGLKIDSSIKPEKMDIRSIELSLKPTEKVAKNSLTISGVLPGSDNPELKGKLDALSEGLDLTRVNTFITNLSSSKKDDKKKEPKEDKEESEPEPIELPFKYLVTNLKIGKLVYDKISADNVEIVKTINDGKIDINPFKFELLGMPINSQLSANVSVPGYEYSGKVDFSDLPLANLIFSLGQEADKSKHAGQMDFALGFSGKGITSTSIKQNFKANTQLNMDGGNMAITGGFRKFVILPIATVLRIDPMLDGVVNQINLDAEFGGNNLNVKKARVATEPFEILTNGSVSVDENIKGSKFKLPLTVSLRRDIAKSANFLPRDTPETQKYVPMPDFVQLVGESFSEMPKVNINEKEIAQMLLKSAAGLPGEAIENATEIIKNPAGTAKDVIKGVGGLIPGVGSGSDDSKDKKKKTPGSLIKGLFE